MRSEVNVEKEKRKEQESCCHFWIVGQPEYGVSKAICKYCHVRAEFKSLFSDSRWSGEAQSELVNLYGRSEYMKYSNDKGYSD